LKDKDSNQYFELSSTMLKKGSKKQRKSLQDFTIYINDEKIKCNKVFSCCLSQAIFQAVLNDASITEYHFNNIHNNQIFFSLFRILDIHSFQSDSYSNREVIECFSIVGFNFKTHISFQDFDDIFWFISLPFSKNQTKLYNKCIKNVATDFQQITIEYLQNLSTQTLELVFCNDSFVRPTETFLFNLIVEDSSKHCLLKFINLTKLKFKNLKRFLEHLEVIEVDFELFENIKQLILFNQDLLHQL
jgi:hypothetical protein